MFYSIAKVFLKLYYCIFFRLEVKGRENIPNEGGVIICANHISNYDPITLGLPLQRVLYFIAKKELFEHKALSILFRALRAFPVARGQADLEAFKYAIKLLKGGEMLGIFAQGTRVKAEEEKAAKAGVALFALKGNAPVVPTAIVGSYKPFSKVVVSYGKPLTLSEYRGKKVRSEELSKIAAEIMQEIETLKREEEAMWK